MTDQVGCSSVPDDHVEYDFDDDEIPSKYTHKERRFYNTIPNRQYPPNEWTVDNLPPNSVPIYGIPGMAAPSSTTSTGALNVAFILNRIHSRNLSDAAYHEIVAKVEKAVAWLVERGSAVKVFSENKLYLVALFVFEDPEEATLFKMFFGD